MAFTYSGTPGDSDLDAVRFEIQDTNAAAPLLQDGEVEWAITDETGQQPQQPAVLTGGPLYASAARCLEALARNLAMQADREVGTLKETYSTAAQATAARAQELRAKAAGYAAPYAGGQSWSEKEAWQQDPDTVDPSFRRGQWNNPYGGANAGGYGTLDAAALPPFGS